MCTSHMIHWNAETAEHFMYKLSTGPICDTTDYTIVGGDTMHRPYALNNQFVCNLL